MLHSLPTLSLKAGSPTSKAFTTQNEVIQLNINHSLHTDQQHMQQWVCSVYKNNLNYLPEDTLPIERTVLLFSFERSCLNGTRNVLPGNQPSATRGFCSSSS